MNKIDKKIWYVGIGFLIAGLLLGWLFFGGESAREEVAEEVHEHKEETVWTCAMHPQIRQKEPGLCPICGMELIPLSSMESAVEDTEIQMTEAAMKIADIQTIKVQRAVPTKEIYLPGRVKADETEIEAVTVRFPGRIEKLYVNYTGQEVKRGQRLASIYSPELIAAQKELLEAVSFRETNPAFFEAAKNKLKLWNLTAAQIQNILDRKEVQYNFDIYSTQSGTVVNKNVNTGDYVNEGQPLFQIADLDKVWVLFDAYESDLAWIQEGDEIKFTIQSFPGQKFSGEVSFIDPVINPETRVALVRTEVKNPKGKLKPEMFAQGILNTELRGADNQLVIPKSSVLWTGKRAIVYVKNPTAEQPTFQYRDVVLGPEAGNFYVVAEGLEAGEEVVANGVFKVDAAAQLQGKVSMMNPQVPGSEVPDMEGMQVPTKAYVEGEVVDFKDDAPTAFKAQLHKVVEAYLALKEGLVEADDKEIAKASSALILALGKVDENLLDGVAREFWAEKKAFLIQHAKICKEADTIEGKRENFSFLSQPLIKVVEAFGAKQTLYIDYCPMANNNKGAYWLSEIEEIRNPYMGHQMLRCGEMKDVIRK